MAATGEEAAAMDSISTAPIPPSALNLKTDPDSRSENANVEGVTENQPPVSKKSSSNSKCHACFLIHCLVQALGIS